MVFFSGSISKLKMTENGKKTAFSSWYLRKYFEYVEDINENNIRVKCLLCKPIPKKYSCAINSTSNLKKHLEVCNC
jgi:hypothetical protein